MTNPFPSNPLWPTNFQGCTITCQYLGLDGTPIAGSVTFTSSPLSLLDSASGIIFVPRTYTATLDNQGRFTITVPATDDPDINPVGWTYNVSENFLGGRKYSILAPQGTTINLADVSPVPSSDGAPIYRGPRGAAGGIQYVNGHTGDVVVLSYTDIGADAAGAASAAQAASLQKTANLSDLASSATARSNLGLGTAATQPIGAFDTQGAAAAAQTAAQAYTDNKIAMQNTAPTWTAITNFSTGVGGGISGMFPPACTKMPWGEVICRGEIRGASGFGAVPGGNQVGILPSGFWPNSQVEFPVSTNYPTSGTGMITNIKVRITPSGQILLYCPNDGSTQVVTTFSLDPIRYFLV